MFGPSLLVLLAFYLLQWALHLGEFEVGALSAQAKFIKEKKQAVEADAGDIAGPQAPKRTALPGGCLRETEQEVGEAKRLIDEVCCGLMHTDPLRRVRGEREEGSDEARATAARG